VSRAFGRNEPCDLDADGLEQVGWRYPPRNQGRDVPERGLFPREARELLVDLAVRECCRHLLGELRETVLELAGKRRIRRRRRTPQGQR
jgi:hypothetical protein